MEIARAVVEFGTEAVLRYRTISGRQDNELPEVFMGGFIASRLYDRFHCAVHIEHSFLAVASSQGIRISEDMIRRIGSLRGDVAVYQDPARPAIVELKVFDECCQPSFVLSDLEKIESLGGLCSVRGYVGVLICETQNVGLEQRIDRLQKSLGRAVHLGEVQWSLHRGWKWCFGCAAASKDPAMVTSKARGG